MVDFALSNPQSDCSYQIARLQAILSNLGIRAFLNKFVGCQCPEEVLAQAKVCYKNRPLLNYFLNEAKKLKHVPYLTELEQEVNAYLKLPLDLKWPRNKKGHLRHPKSWTRKFLAKVYPEEYIPVLSYLRKLVFVEYEAVIEVPKRAFFFIKAAQAPFPDAQIDRAYACGELLTRLHRYHRFRLITITTPKTVVKLDKIDKALSWQELEYR